MNRKFFFMKYIKILGKILMILSLIFIVYRLYKMDFNLDFFSHPYRVIVIVLLLSFFVVVNNVINAYVWKRNIDFFSGSKQNVLKVICVYLKANIEKYLPGNVIQYAGRNILGKNEEINQTSLTFSSIMELLGISISAIVFSFMVSLQNTKSVIKQLWLSIEIRRTIIAIVAIGVVVLVICFIVCAKKGYLKVIQPYIKRKLFNLGVLAFLLYSVNYIISGVLYSLIFLLVLQCKVNFFQIASTNVLAWLSGYVVPGSPGGIGIREAVLILLLGDDYPMEMVAMSAVILRLCGIIGDFFSYVLAMGLDLHNHKWEI